MHVEFRRSASWIDLITEISGAGYTQACREGCAKGGAETCSQAGDRDGIETGNNGAAIHDGSQTRRARKQEENQEKEIQEEKVQKEEVVKKIIKDVFVVEVVRQGAAAEGRR